MKRVVGARRSGARSRTACLLLVGGLLAFAGCRDIAGYEPYVPPLKSLFYGECDCTIKTSNSGGGVWSQWNARTPGEGYCTSSVLADPTVPPDALVVAENTFERLQYYCNQISVKHPDMPLQCTPRVQQPGDHVTASPYIKLVKLHGCVGQSSFTTGAVPAFSSILDIDLGRSALNLTVGSHRDSTPVAGQIAYTGGERCYLGAEADMCKMTVHRVAVSDGGGRLDFPELCVEDLWASMTKTMTGHDIHRIAPGTNQVEGPVYPEADSLFRLTGQGCQSTLRHALDAPFKDSRGNLRVFNVVRDFDTKDFGLSGELSGRTGGENWALAINLHGTSQHQPPYVDAGPNLAVACTDPIDGANIRLQGRVVSPDSDDVAYRSFWYVANTPGNYSVVTSNDLQPWVQLPVGTHLFTLYVETHAGGSGAPDTFASNYDTVIVEVTEPCH